MEQELKKALALKGKKLTKNEKFLVEQFWNDSEFVLQKYYNGSIGYHRINQ